MISGHPREDRTAGIALERKSADDYFRDWESHVFGFGYGSGEECVMGALRTFFELTPHQYDYQVLEAALTPPVAWLLINALCRHGVSVIEYGTSPRYGWLTKIGHRVRDYMMAHSLDDVLEVLGADYDGWCYPDACNCGPNGYDSAATCQNPFWLESAKPADGESLRDDPNPQPRGGTGDE